MFLFCFIFAFVDSCCFDVFLCVISVELSLLVLLLQLYTLSTSSNAAVAAVYFRYFALTIAAFAVFLLRYLLNLLPLLIFLICRCRYKNLRVAFFSLYFCGCFLCLKTTILMNINWNISNIIQLLNSAYNNVRFYNFNNFSDVTENRRYQGYLFLGICACRCNTFFLYFRFLVEFFHWVFPLSILIWFAGRDIVVQTQEQRKLRFRIKVICRLSYI